MILAGTGAAVLVPGGPVCPGCRGPRVWNLRKSMVMKPSIGNAVSWMGSSSFVDINYLARNFISCGFFTFYFFWFLKLKSTQICIHPKNFRLSTFMATIRQAGLMCFYFQIYSSREDWYWLGKRGFRFCYFYLGKGIITFSLMWNMVTHTWWDCMFDLKLINSLTIPMFQ